MDHSGVNEDNIPLLHPDDDNDDDDNDDGSYKAPNTSRDPDDTPSTVPRPTEKETTSTL